MSKKNPEAVDGHIGRRLRQARHARDMSQADLGNKIGVTFQQIQKYENGTNRISASRLTKAAEALGVSVAWFWEGVQERGLLDETGRPDPFVELAGHPDGHALAAAFNKLRGQMRKNALAIIVLLAASTPQTED